MAKPQSLSKEAQEYLREHSHTLTIPEIAEKYGISYNSAIHYIRFNGLAYKGTKGNVRQRVVNEFDKCPITGF